ncbi:phage integrase SAM-like domain-containing protein [Laribacter hongkongensis]|uniref:Putative phage integrase n=1 Tax=Laribacter hongkongensis TaxID=168471 RepID=A0A248LNA2_9NEIS|nr:phage integrase SAM-like domain-containing protein [Laribacter hongkongensis]ASJ25979.1 putative phage integrase [Laribacter hongkongensis]MCG9040038.1 phage integrase SAM-like domain-containing protein [Laribacter hongkongensis]MCG9109662.1 phage integrase SAM-like domain-containing protein [Laribacter hongkongensis]MCG9121444.1 phage integrase SAM-like domain-containing protein [Laribacter hongkongensis]
MMRSAVIRPIPSGGGTSWLVLLERWASERVPTSKTLAEWRLYVDRFLEQNPAVTVEQTEKSHVVGFKDWLVAKQYSSATVEKHLTAIKRLLGWALDNDIISRNPASGVRVAKAANAAPGRQPYSLEDLNAIFGMPIFRKAERPKAGRGEAAFWLPLLGLFTGARLEELGQLLCSDVRERDRVNYIAISDAEEGQSVKTSSSRRLIPLHPELLRLGFLDYVADQRKRGHQHLFHLLESNRHGACTAAWSKWYGRFARTPSLNMPKSKVFHSFRHTFKDAARNSGIPKDVHDAFTGHSANDVGSTYGNGPSLQSLAVWISKLEYPGLQLDFTWQSERG